MEDRSQTIHKKVGLGFEQACVSMKLFFVHTFKHRELYVRGDGKVSFFTLTPLRQILLTVAFVGVVLFCAVALYVAIEFKNIRNDHLLAEAKLRADYEGKIIAMKQEREILNDEIKSSHNWFDETTRALERKHKIVYSLLNEHTSTLNTLDNLFDTINNMNVAHDRHFKTVLTAGKLPKAMVYLKSRRYSTVPLSAYQAESKNQENSEIVPPNIIQNDLQSRIDRLIQNNHDLLTALEESTDRKIGTLTDLIASTELPNPEQFLANAFKRNESGIGGPYIPNQNNRQNTLPYVIAGENHASQQNYRITNNISILSDLMHTVSLLPISAPLRNYPVTSRFGDRLDPFRNRIAHHAGVDYGSPKGAEIRATLSGKVVFAGRKSQYGLTVEIQHENGFLTRYAHLLSTTVTNGQSVKLHDVIAKSGNSGRSTGPHLHYEIWYNGQVRDPMLFLNAGQRIFTIATGAH